MELQRNYSATTQNIRVTVVPRFLAEESEVSRGIYVFAYTVTIENHGSTPAQLIGRHWLVFSAGALFNEVKGVGVVGEQPVIEPGESYEYTSSAAISDPFGSMRGSYSFTLPTGESVEAEIPEFDLYCPEQLH